MQWITNTGGQIILEGNEVKLSSDEDVNSFALQLIWLEISFQYQTVKIGDCWHKFTVGHDNLKDIAENLFGKGLSTVN